jgi:hypothetical protein
VSRSTYKQPLAVAGQRKHHDDTPVEGEIPGSGSWMASRCQV